MTATPNAGDIDQLLEKLGDLIGERDPDALRRRMGKELGMEGSTVAGSGLRELGDKILDRQGLTWPADGADPSQSEAFVHLATTLDERVPMMLAAWSHLGHTSPMPMSHRQLLTRIHEDDRFVGKPAPEGMNELVLAIMRACDSGVSTDELDEFIVSQQPTTFCYETIQARLEGIEPKLDSASVSRGSADIEESTESDESEDEEDEPSALEPINALVRTYSVRHLFDLVQAGRLDLEPPWQRRDVWSRKKKRELVKSLLLGIPLPSIILHKRGLQISIIDGKQRLTAICQFMRNEFKLPNFDVPSGHKLHGCRGAWFKKEGKGKRSLPEGVQTDFELQEVPVLQFAEVSEGRLRQIFHLYNVSGTRLNAAEIRNAVYQTNRIHRVAYILAGEARPVPDLGLGDHQAQLEFTERLTKTLPTRARYAIVAFLSRYLGYSRAAQRDESQPFHLVSTSSTINRYFDYASDREDSVETAKDVIRAFDGAERFFDGGDDEQLPFHLRNERGERKFNALIATSNMIAARFLLDAIGAGLTTDSAAEKAAKAVRVRYPENQQTATIWDYQARLLNGLRGALGIDPGGLSTQWATFFKKMAYAQLPDRED